MPSSLAQMAGTLCALQPAPGFNKPLEKCPSWAFPTWVGPKKVPPQPHEGHEHRCGHREPQWALGSSPTMLTPDSSSMKFSLIQLITEG